MQMDVFHGVPVESFFTNFFRAMGQKNSLTHSRAKQHHYFFLKRYKVDREWSEKKYTLKTSEEQDG